MLEIEDILEGKVKEEGKLVIDTIWIPGRRLELDEGYVLKRDREHIQLDMNMDEFLIKADAIIAIQYHYEYDEEEEKSDIVRGSENYEQNTRQKV